MQINKKRASRGFSLIEVMVALVVLGLTTCCAYWALMKANEMAEANRLYTEAMRQVENQIDLILGDSPFVANANTTLRIPYELTVGTKTQNVTLYTDPALNINVVSGTMKTVVTDISSASFGSPNYYYRATVTLTYYYRNKSYQVIMSTVRGSDL